MSPEPTGVEQQPALGMRVLDVAGQAIGVVSALGLDATTGRPDWLVLTTAGGRRTAVPSYAASLTAGGDVVLPFAVTVVEAAPSLASDAPSAAQVRTLLAHYGLDA